MSDALLSQVKELLTQLTPPEKAEVVSWLGKALKAELPQSPLGARQSVRGLWSQIDLTPRHFS